MLTRFSVSDPNTDPIAKEVRKAFADADASVLPSTECYKRAVAVWRQAYPEHSASYAATKAVEVILARRGKALMTVDK